VFGVERRKDAWPPTFLTAFSVAARRSESVGSGWMSEGCIYSDPRHDQQLSLGPFGLLPTRGRAQETSRRPGRVATPRPTSGNCWQAHSPADHPRCDSPPPSGDEPWGPVWPHNVQEAGGGLTRWTVRIPHHGRGGAAGRTTRRKTWSRLRSDVFVPFTTEGRERRPSPSREGNWVEAFSRLATHARITRRCWRRTSVAGMTSAPSCEHPIQ
jgi:hypothetical protein